METILRKIASLSSNVTPFPEFGTVASSSLNAATSHEGCTHPLCPSRHSPTTLSGTGHHMLSALTRGAGWGSGESGFPVPSGQLGRPADAAAPPLYRTAAALYFLHTPPPPPPPQPPQPPGPVGMECGATYAAEAAGGTAERGGSDRRAEAAVVTTVTVAVAVTVTVAVVATVAEGGGGRGSAAMRWAGEGHRPLIV